MGRTALCSQLKCHCSKWGLTNQFFDQFLQITIAFPAHTDGDCILQPFPPRLFKREAPSRRMVDCENRFARPSHPFSKVNFPHTDTLKLLLTRQHFEAPTCSNTPSPSPDSKSALCWELCNRLKLPIAESASQSIGSIIVHGTTQVVLAGVSS